MWSVASRALLQLKNVNDDKINLAPSLSSATIFLCDCADE